MQETANKQKRMTLKTLHEMLNGMSVELAEKVLYDDLGNEESRILLTPGGVEPGSFPAVHVPMGQYHTCKSLERGTVIIEFKNTKYDPERTEEFSCWRLHDN